MKLSLPATPTGLLHVGHARIALAAWLTARRHGAKILLRLDDLDPRARDTHADAIRFDLDWLGLDWDGAIQQSDRLPRYAAAAARLEQSGRLYPCFESEDELRAKRDQRQRRGAPTIYDRAMLKLTAAQRAEAEAGGKRPYWRFRLSGAPAHWTDLVLGQQYVKTSALSDPILIRADGTPYPLFAAAVDDMDHGVTHLVRGADHATATGLQIDLWAALGARPAALRFAHLPLLAGEDAPRPGARPPTLRSLRTDGVEPAALATYLTWLDAPGAAPDPEPPALLASKFDLARIPIATPSFDTAPLLALNRKALRHLPFEAVRDRIPPGATDAFWRAIRGGIDLLREARLWHDVVAGPFIPPLLPDEAATLQQARAALPPEPWDATTWSTWTTSLQRTDGREAESLRQALTGETEGPPMAALLPLIGHAQAKTRLAQAISAPAPAGEA